MVTMVMNCLHASPHIGTPTTPDKGKMTAMLKSTVSIIHYCTIVGY